MRRRDDKDFSVGSVWRAKDDVSHGAICWVMFCVVRKNNATLRTALVLDTGYRLGTATDPGVTFEFDVKWTFCERCERLA